MAKQSRIDKEEKEMMRNGVNNSLYLSKDADKLLTKYKGSMRRSKSVIVSLLIEQFGAQVEKAAGL